MPVAERRGPKTGPFSFILSTWAGNFCRPDSNVPVCPGAWENPIQFTGYYSDGDVFEHYYARARYYDPYTGRFLSRDPADFEYDKVPIAINRYPYAGNNPLRYVDPNGKFIFAAIFGLVWQAIVADIACYAVAGGIYELAHGGSFLEGFVSGAVIGGFSTFLSAAYTEITGAGALMRAGTTNLLTDYQTFSIMSGVMTGTNQFHLLLRHGPMGGEEGPFFSNIHHGSLGQLFLLGLGAFGNIQPWAIPFYGIGAAVVFDDFIQHSLLQVFDPEAKSPIHMIFTDIIYPWWERNFGD